DSEPGSGFAHSHFEPHQFVEYSLVSPSLSRLGETNRFVATLLYKESSKEPAHAQTRLYRDFARTSNFQPCHRPCRTRLRLERLRPHGGRLSRLPEADAHATRPRQRLAPP